MSMEHKRPHFKQSAITFLLLGITFLAFALGNIFI